MDAQAWLLAHTFYCSRLRARITPRQCGINRGRPDVPELTNDGALPPGRPTPCRDCRDWEHKEETMGKDVGICACCGRQGRIEARGLDRLCYGLFSRRKIKRRADGLWDVASEEALDRINEMRLAAGLPERGLSAGEALAAVREPASAPGPESPGNSAGEETASPQEPGDTDSGTPDARAQEPDGAPSGPKMESYAIDGEILPLIPREKALAQEAPYLLVARSLKVLGLPLALARILPPGTSAVRIYGRAGARFLALRPVGADDPEARPLRARSKGQGRQVYCEPLIKALGLEPGRYPLEARPDGALVARLDRGAA